MSPSRLNKATDLKDRLVPSMATTMTVGTPAKYPDLYSPETGTYRSKYRPLDLPEDPFLDVVSHIFAHNHNGGFAFTDSTSGYSISYAELQPLVKSMASGLHQLGVSQGDVVLLLLPNSVYYPIVFLGVLYLGATVTSMIPYSSGSEIKRQVSDCGVSFAFTTSDRVDEFNVLGINVLAVPENSGGSIESEFSSFYKVISSGCSISRPVIKQEQTAAILYSSGTTGVSKGVVLTHRNLIAMVELFVRFEASQYAGSSSLDHVYLAVLPMSHIYGLSLFVLGLLSLGSRTVVMKRFNVDEVVNTIDRFSVTHFPVVPPILKALTKTAKSNVRIRLRSLKQVSCGAASLDKQSIDDFLETLPHVDFIQGYGMTETTAVGTRGFNTEKFKNYSSVGLLAPNMEAKVVDWRNGLFLPPGMNGELWLRGPGIMQGYLNNAKATMSTINEEGWLHTGDIVHFDHDGYLYIIDRLKDTIKYKGFQISPADLESALISHPEIVDVAVAGVADDVSGEIPVAFVIRRRGSNLSEKDVIEYAAKQVAPYKKVRKVLFVPTIPKSPAGKVLRRELRESMASRL